MIEQEWSIWDICLNTFQRYQKGNRLPYVVAYCIVDAVHDKKGINLKFMRKCDKEEALPHDK